MRVTTLFVRAAFGLLVWIAAGASWAADEAADLAGVRHALMAQFDKPEARLQVEPVVVSGDAAVASWAQGERGGRALLLRRSGTWQITLCAGDGLKGVSLLREAGVPARDAESLARRLAAAEAKLAPAWRAKFSTFDGLVRMGPDGHHPPVGGKH